MSSVQNELNSDTNCNVAMDHINIGLRTYTIILIISTLSFLAGSNINCNGKAFYCVNSTHFKICVDLGGGVSTTVDEFLIQCPRNTVCKQYNLFECEYELTTTLPPLTIQNEVTKEQFQTSESSVWEQLDVTTLFPTKQQQGMELSEKYYNKVNTTPASFSARFLTDVTINPETYSNTNDLHTRSNSDINKTLNISLSLDKELTFSKIESEMGVTQMSPYNINTLVRNNSVSSNYNTETPLFFATVPDRRNTNTFKSASLESKGQNNSDLDAGLTVTKRTNQVSSISEFPFSDTVTLLPGNFSNQSLQENALRISNINHLIKSDNKSQEHNLDILIEYNTTPLNNLDNNTQYRNNSSIFPTNMSTDINRLNSTTHNVFKNEIFSSNVSNTNKISKVDNVTTTESLEQHLAEITTASTIIIPGTTNHFSSHMSLNTAEVIQTFLNDGLNITKYMEKLNVTDNIMILTTTMPETSVVKTNEMSTQITDSGLNYGVSSVALTNPILNEKNATRTSQTTETKSSKLTNDNEILDFKNKFQVNSTTELNIANVSQYLTTTEPNLFIQSSNISILSTSKSEITSPINIREILYLSSQEATQVHNASQIDNVVTIDIGSTNTDRTYDIHHNLTFFDQLVSTKDPKKHSTPSSLLLSNISIFTTAPTKSAPYDKIIVEDYSFTSADMLPVLTTAEISNGVISSKPLSDLISRPETWPKPVTITVATDLDNNNITSTKVSDNITAVISNGVTISKQLSELSSGNETWPKPVTITVATDLDNNNITSTKVSDNITAEISNGVTISKQLSELSSGNETWPKPVTITVATDLDNNNITSTKVSDNITAEISNGVTISKQLSELSSGNETWPKPVTITVATDSDNNNIRSTKANNNITVKISKGVISSKPLSDLTSRIETWPKPVTITVATDLDNNNITSTKVSDNITAVISNGVTISKQLSELSSGNETWPKPVTITVATDLDNNNITSTKVSDNITAAISNGVTISKQLSELSSGNETWPKPVTITVATDLDNNNITSTKVSDNITAEISNGVTISKQLSELSSGNETWPKPVTITVATDSDNNNIRSTKANNNITVKISKGVISSKPLSDLTSRIETWPKPVTITVATDLDNNNITSTKVSDNITAVISNGVTISKQLSELSSGNETWPKPVTITVATDLDNNNITSTKVSDNITAEISNGVTISKQLSELSSGNETWPKPVTITVATDLDNNNITSTKVSDNITAEISNGVTISKQLSELSSGNETWPKPVTITVATDLDNNNITSTKVSDNITAEISNGVTISKQLSELSSGNETWPKPVTITVATDLDNNNITSTKVSDNITAEISNGVTISKQLSELSSGNETWPKPVTITVATDLDNNNITSTKVSDNITAEISNGVTISKQLSELSSGNETWPKPVTITVATDLDNNNITSTKVSDNITAEISNGVTISKQLSELSSGNETWPKPVTITVATDLDNNNITSTKVSYNITAEISNGVTISKQLSELSSGNETWPKPVTITVATDLDNNNITRTKVSDNITAEISNGVTISKQLSELSSGNETWPKPVTITVATEFDNNNITTTKASNNIIAEIYNGVTTVTSISDLTSTTSIIRPTVLKLLTVTDTYDSLDKENVLEISGTIFTDNQSLNESAISSSTFTKVPDYILKTKPNNSTTHNNDVTKSVINSLYEINKALSSNSTLRKISEVYQTTTDSNIAFSTEESSTGAAVFESGNSMDVTNNTSAVIDVLSEYRAVSDNNRGIENASKLGSTVTTKPSTYFDTNTSKHIFASEIKTVTTFSSELAKKDYNKKQIITKNDIIYNNDQILNKNSIGNPILTKLTTEDIVISKLGSTNNFSLTVDLNVSNTNNNITDKNNRSFKDIVVKHNQDTNNLVEKLLTVHIIKSDLNYTHKNVPVSNNSKSVPLTYLPSSVIKPHLTDIYNISHSYFSESMSPTLTFDTTTASNKFHETEDKESSQINKNELALVHAISNIEHEGNKTEYSLLNTCKQVNTTAKNVNDTTLKELFYNISESSLAVRNSVKSDFIMENITTSTDKSTAPKDFHSTKGTGFNKLNSITTNINVRNYTNRSELADDFQLSDITKSQRSGNAIEPLLIAQPLGEVNNTTGLYPENGNLSLKPEHRFQGYVSDRINKTKISEINNLNRSELIAPVKINASPNNYSENIINNWGVVNTTLVADATKPSKTYEYNVSEVKSVSIMRIKDNYTNDLNATSETNITANSLLRNTSCQTNSIKNKTHHAMAANALEISRIPSDRSSQSTGSLNISKMATTSLISNKTKLVLISEQENTTISEHINRSNGIEEKQLRNDQGHTESTLTVGNGATKIKIRNNTIQHQNSFNKPINNINYTDPECGNMRTSQEFNCTKRGKYSDTNDCSKFYVCIGKVKPIIGVCPTDTVFSEYLKHCTKNITHCIRNNQFKCTAAGRFNNILFNNTYFICAKNKSSFIRFTLKCQRGYYLDKYNIKCIPDLINITISNENSSKNAEELSSEKSKEMGGVTVNNKNYFECEKEGIFNDPQDCRKYYVCKKGRQSTFRRRIKKCDSDEVYHRKKKKCVDVESYECDT